KQALLNLFLNALQSMPEGGTLRVSTKTEGESIVVEIEDSGAGIDPEIRDKIFSPFFTTKSKGSGLGLTVVRRVAHQHGGNVEFETSEEKGTLFRIRLPMLNTQQREEES